MREQWFAIDQAASINHLGNFLLSDRRYRKVWFVEKVLGWLKSYCGKRFVPERVDAFFE